MAQDEIALQTPMTSARLLQALEGEDVSAYPVGQSRRGNARRVGGLTLAAMNVPQALGYTKIAGMPVVTGLYTLLLPLVAFAAFGSSRYLVVAADSATAAILAGGLSHMAPVASEHYVALAGLVALLTAGCLLLARLFKLGFLADFLSQTVLVGFLTGVGFQVGIAVLGEMLGVPVDSRRTVEQLAQVVRGLPEVHVPTLCISAAVVAIILILPHVSPRLPGPFLAVVGAVAASAAVNFSAHGIAVIGPVAAGLPRLGVPNVRWGEALALVPVAGLVLSDDRRSERSDGARLCVAPSRNTRRKRGSRRVCLRPMRPRRSAAHSW